YLLALDRLGPRPVPGLEAAPRRAHRALDVGLAAARHLAQHAAVDRTGAGEGTAVGRIDVLAVDEGAGAQLQPVGHGLPVGAGTWGGHGSPPDSLKGMTGGPVRVLRYVPAWAAAGTTTARPATQAGRPRPAGACGSRAPPVPRWKARRWRGPAQRGPGWRTPPATRTAACGGGAARRSTRATGARRLQRGAGGAFGLLAVHAAPQNVAGVLALTITASPSPTLRKRCGIRLSK